jgi:hypothetical protein
MATHSFCHKCGVKLNSIYQFCPSCGSVLGQRTNLPANSDLPSGFSNDPFNLWKNSLKTSSGQNNKLFKVIAICLMIGVTLIALNSMMFSNSGVSSVELEREQAIREYERCFDRKYNEMLIMGGWGVAEMHAKAWCGTPP